MSKKPYKPLIRGGGIFPSDNLTTLVYPGNKATCHDDGIAGDANENNKSEEAADAIR